MSKKTGIICTIGPASRSEKMLVELIRAGMNVARLNFAHGTLVQHAEDIGRIRMAAKMARRTCDILIDLPGPKIRVGKLKNEPLQLHRGQTLWLTSAKKQSSHLGYIPVDYPDLNRSLRKGSLVYLNDGFIQLKVESEKPPAAKCKVLVGGLLLSHKGLNFPSCPIYLEPVTETDVQYLAFGLANGVDLFGISFLVSAKDILKAKTFAKARGKVIRTVAKIERAEAVKNLDSILKVTDMVMVARGDLGVQIPLEQVPLVQKRIIRDARRRGVPAITATQMLESMVEHIRPTRAEVSDVANAILDGTDYVMLSEETAIGQYPVEAVEWMHKIARAVETKGK
jgi:pyruvate kinase